MLPGHKALFATAMSQAQHLGLFGWSEEDHYREIARRHCELIARIDPLVKIMMEIRMMQPMRYFIVEGRHIEPEILWMPGSKETYDLCQQMIDDIKQQYLPGGE